MSQNNAPSPLLPQNDLNPYTILEISPTGSEAEIKQAYFRQVRQHPPEKDPEAFKQIRAAYETLKDPQKRLEFDLLQPEPWPEAVAAKPRRTKTESLRTTLAPADIRRVARAFTELIKHDFRDDYRPVKELP